MAPAWLGVVPNVRARSGSARSSRCRCSSDDSLDRRWCASRRCGGRSGFDAPREIPLPAAVALSPKATCIPQSRLAVLIHSLRRAVLRCAGPSLARKRGFAAACAELKRELGLEVGRASPNSVRNPAVRAFRAAHSRKGGCGGSPSLPRKAPSHAKPTARAPTKGGCGGLPHFPRKTE